MIIEKIGTGKTVEEAKENALIEMGLGIDTEVDYDFEIIDLPKSKTFGLFGGTPAKVRVFREVEDVPEVEEKPAAKAKKKTEPAKSVKSDVKPSKPIGKLSSEQTKEVVDYLENILKLMGVQDFTTNVVELEDGIMININGPKLGVAIGRKGETIDALQHLVSLVANRGKSEYFRVTLNPGEYREKRESVLIGVAEKSAEKALRTRRNVVLEPMNSYERRIIHNTVQNIENVESWSVGENDHRRVVIGNKEFNNNNNRGSYRGRGNGRGSYGRNNRGRAPKPNYSVKAEPTREPIKDSANLPLYGVVKHDSQD